MHLLLTSITIDRMNALFMPYAGRLNYFSWLGIVMTLSEYIYILKTTQPNLDPVMN